ncbi:type VI secretion system Vgr family protein [Sinomicrobium weinanense]|uniref:Gp5/Type VI secretion system Vgr protein OB-fold domain-containing protein n=1 Tax=Sinomicrobium weinanense TaxID=2842200 RepID=A0A926JPZ0_9FLAO|nr:phage baseplate assembly protein V [Sinomicrobium weinanense]MBC9795226.1 hypothetical protein [Sinomicrobium weinanense]MBU3122003.1 hypothetical protein [Sinomicrobium weinanense]
MAMTTRVIISIEGDSIDEFAHLKIIQKTNAHHKFSFLETFNKGFSADALDKMQNYIGRSVHIRITPLETLEEGEMVFKGVITEANLIRSGGDAGGIAISGYSPTVYMDGVPNTKNFIGESLPQVIHEATRNHAGKVKFSKDVGEEPLDYTVQYKESDFSFLRRLARKKGHWFYYNGEELIFGKPKSRHINLQYGKTLEKFNIGAGTAPLGFKYTGYDPTSADTQYAKSTETGYQSRGLTQAMMDISRKIYPEGESNLLYHHPLREGNARSHLVDRVKTQLHGRVSRLVTVNGASEDTRFRIGDVISIKEPKYGLTNNPKDLVQEKFYGSYYVISVTHSCDGNGNYSNEFTAVPEAIEAPPYTDVLTPPLAETQPAEVIDNNDPKGLGRVRVKFHWDYESPWIRMVQPHGGGNKGFYFIPEKGEEVMVAFEGGNAEKPYITGTMYNGNQKSGYATANNDFKVIHTRSGHIIKLDDTNGSENITITDKNKNTIFIDTAGNNIDITANETMTLNARNLLLNIQEDMNVQVGNNKTESISQDHSVTATNTLEIISGNKTVQVSETFEQSSSEATMVTLSGDMNIKGAGLATFQGGSDVKVSKG